MLFNGYILHRVDGRLSELEILLLVRLFQTLLSLLGQQTLQVGDLVVLVLDEHQLLFVLGLESVDTVVEHLGLVLVVLLTGLQLHLTLGTLLIGLLESH